MTSLPFDSLPVQHAPERGYLDLHTLVPEMMDLYPTWTDDDLRCFVEERTRGYLDPEAVITLRAVYLRCYRLRREFEGY